MTAQHAAGLPVWFSILPGGDVEVEVDLSEAGRGIDEASDGVAGIEFREAVERACAQHGNTVKVILAAGGRVTAVTPPIVWCGRHHGTWGEDPGCPRCSYPEDQGPRPVDDPGPLTGDPDLSEPWPAPTGGGHVRVIKEGK